MVVHLKPRDKKWAKFQFGVHKRVESWCKEKHIDYTLGYAPILRSGQPDIVLDIKRDPSELDFSFSIDGSTDDGALEDYTDFFYQKKAKMIFRVILDPTEWEPGNQQKWKERIDRMLNYCKEMEEDDFCVVSFPVIVSPYGWDQSLNHGVQRDVHIISLNHLKDFLDSIYQSTNFYEPRVWLPKIFRSKYEGCPSCGHPLLSFEPTYSCAYAGGYSKSFTQETFDNFLVLVETDTNKPPAEEQSICCGCSYDKYCDGFGKSFDVVCKKCGWTDSTGLLHPCSLAISEQYDDSCINCDGPHECELYKKLKKEGHIA